ncbi:DUF4942 domain-containing protein [Escherichia coli]|uniref:DUF4942 domain-containing protein n=1 Tax=Escherichia coli TaxID=562 RepID=UPI0013660DF2|nr:DUF4942 domain-containing protein [Escherichia coli]MWT73268.1 DUF4942 domain-containing protein [Escherichia coli]
MTLNSQPDLKLSTRTEQIASNRDMAMQRFLEGMTLIAEASAICGFSLFNSKIMAPNAFGLPGSISGSIEEGRQQIDRNTWIRLFEETGIDRFWNHNQRSAFSESLRSSPPIASLAVIRNTLRQAIATRSITLAEGFVDLLCQLDRRYKSNSQKFVMTKKLILRGIFPGSDMMRYNGFSQDNLFYLNDFENIVCICSKAATPPVGSGKNMYDRLAALRKNYFTGDIIDPNGWKCRLFENGNVHIYVECERLLNALNDLICIYFANQIPAKG